MTDDSFEIFLPQHICRCCGMKKSSVINIQNAGVDRVEKILKVLNLLPKRVINISPTDKLTKFVCIDCEVTLLHFNEFCEMIRKAQQLLKSSISQSKERKLFSDKNNKTLDKLKKKSDCHVSGVSSSGSVVMISVGGDGNIKCEDCQRSLVMSELISLNMLTHGLGSVLCACRHCGHHDDISSFLHHNNSLVNCPKCMFSDFQSPPVVRVAANKPKASEGKYTCEVCSARFQKVYCYNRHKLIHLGIKPFLCETCGMKFNQKNSLKLHMLKHNQKSPHVCKWCGQSFRFKVSLHSHTLNTHGSLLENTKRFECDQCKKQFATIYKLRRHYRGHTGDRPYECTVCNRWFTQSGNLQTHMKKHKTDTFETFSTDELLESGNEILETILDSCTEGEQFISMEQQSEANFGLVGDGNVDKHNGTDLFSDFNPQDVLFDNTPILDPTETPLILPNFSSLQGGSSDINM